jgi:hypothetical protein
MLGHHDFTKIPETLEERSSSFNLLFAGETWYASHDEQARKSISHPRLGNFTPWEVARVETADTQSHWPTESPLKQILPRTARMHQAFLSSYHGLPAISDFFAIAHHAIDTTRWTYSAAFYTVTEH